MLKTDVNTSNTDRRSSNKSTRHEDKNKKISDFSELLFVVRVPEILEWNTQFYDQYDLTDSSQTAVRNMETHTMRL